MNRKLSSSILLLLFRLMKYVRLHASQALSVIHVDRHSSVDKGDDDGGGGDGTQSSLTHINHKMFHK